MRARTVLGADLESQGREAKNDLLWPYLARSGSGCLAYSTLQPGLIYFLIEKVGYIAFGRFWHPVLARRGRRIVVADPICDPAHSRRVLETFLETGEPTIFLQIGGRIARELNELGLRVVEFGYESEIDLPSFSMNTRPKKTLRRNQHKAEREGVKVFEREISAMDVAEVRRVSDDWLRRKRKREFALLTRPLIYERERGVRYYWGERDGSLIALAIFDPMFWQGNVVGYCQNFVRYAHGAPHETIDLITVRALLEFQREGVKTMSFGLSPLARADEGDGDGRGARFPMPRLFRLIRKWGGWMYPFQGIELYKNRYDPQRSRVYCASTERNIPFESLLVVKAMNLI